MKADLVLEVLRPLTHVLQDLLIDIPAACAEKPENVSGSIISDTGILNLRTIAR